MDRSPLLTEGCYDDNLQCIASLLPKPVGFKPAVRFRGVDFETIYTA